MHLLLATLERPTNIPTRAVSRLELNHDSVSDFVLALLKFWSFPESQTPAETCPPPHPSQLKPQELKLCGKTRRRTMMGGNAAPGCPWATGGHVTWRPGLLAVCWACNLKNVCFVFVCAASFWNSRRRLFGAQQMLLAGQHERACTTQKRCQWNARGRKSGHGRAPQTHQKSSNTVATAHCTMSYILHVASPSNLS